MSGPHGEHRASVDHAMAAVGLIQEAIALVTDRQEAAMGAVIMAVGHNPNVESAQNAMNFCAEVRNRTEELFRITEAINQELLRYQGGF